MSFVVGYCGKFGRGSQEGEVGGWSESSGHSLAWFFHIGRMDRDVMNLTRNGSGIELDESSKQR